MNNKDLVVKALVGALNREKNREQMEPIVISNIVGGLALIADPETVAPIFDVVKTSSHEPTIYNAIAAFKSIKNNQAIEALITLFEIPKEDIGGKAVEAVIDIGSPAVDFLIPALKHSYSVVRQRVAICLGAIGEKRALEPLITLLESDEHPNVIGMAAWAIGEIEGEPNTDVNISYG